MIEGSKSCSSRIQDSVVRMCNTHQFSYQSCPTLCNTMDYIAHQASLSITNFQSLLKLMSIESVMPYNNLILCHPLLLPPSIYANKRVFSNESVLLIKWPKGVSASASVLPLNIQDWFPLGQTGWISLQSKGLSRVFFNTTVQKHQFFSARLSFIVQLSHPYMTTRKTIALTRQILVAK